MRATASAAGRADLVAAFAAGGDAALLAMARLLGYEARATETARRQRAEEEGAADRVPGRTFESRPEPASQLAPLPFWRLEEIEHLGIEPARPPEKSAQPIGFDGLGRSAGTAPQAPPLVSDARLWAALRRRLASTVRSREVDVAALAERWGRGRPLREIPFRPLAAWAPRVTVLVDRSAHLIPFWRDQDRLLRQLRRRLGRAAIHQVRFVEGYERPWRGVQRRYRDPPVSPGAPVLALGDLGFFAGEARRDLWSKVAELQRRGGALPTALVPCPPDRWQGGIARRWDALSWERPGRAQVAAFRRPDAARLDRAERLLALLSFAARIEVGLLRAVRLLLPATDADAGTEADVWNHPEVEAGFALAVGPSPELRRRLQARFAREPNPRKLAVVKAMRAFQAARPAEVWLDEVLGLDAGGDLPAGALSPEELAAAEDLWRRAGATIETGMASPAEVARAVRGFVDRSVRERLPTRAWSDERWKPLLWKAWEAAWQGEGAPPLPAGAGPEMLGPGEGVLRRWEVWQVGGTLSFVSSRSRFGSYPEAGSLLAEVESTNGLLAAFPEGLDEAPARPLGEGVVLPRSATLLLRTDRTVATLRCHPRPEWANAMGRDHFGLWASFAVGDVEQRMRWIPPGRFWMGSPEDEEGRYGDEGPRHLETIEQGFWLADTPCTQELWQAVMGKNPSNFQEQKKPVEQMSWDDCKEFLEKLGKREGDAGEGWRLPHEKEWEYACRAGTETATYAGRIDVLDETQESVLQRIAWFNENSGGATQPVAQKAPNPWGLYDMLGNVYQWCEDLWSDGYDAERKGSSRVIRGGSWSSYAQHVRAAYRIRDDPSNRWDSLGFRFARGQSALQAGAEPSGAERPARDRARRGTRPPAPGPRVEGGKAE